MEASVFLVGTAVFNTDVARYPGQAGSIPVRLRHLSFVDCAAEDPESTTGAAKG